MAGTNAVAAAPTLAALLIVRPPEPRLPMVSPPTEFHFEPVPSTVTDAVLPAAPVIVSARPRPWILAPPLTSNAPLPPRPTVTLDTALRLAVAVTFHSPVPPNCRAAAVPLPPIAPP